MSTIPNDCKIIKTGNLKVQLLAENFDQVIGLLQQLNQYCCHEKEQQLGHLSKQGPKNNFSLFPQICGIEQESSS